MQIRLSNIFISFLYLATTCLGSEKDIISAAAHSAIPTKSNYSDYASAFQELANALGDHTAAKELGSNPVSDEFKQGLHSLLADVNRAMWVYFDDKETLSYLRLLASRIRGGL
ncbi:hypothetical protein BX070DRAFT_134071 [Coemansia spiralis]|nr:hypothetical protein BX070DRAFT_134071 [Coemansia spiralis]